MGSGDAESGAGAGWANASPRRKEFLVTCVLQLRMLLMLPDQRTGGLQCWRWSRGRWQVPPGFLMTPGSSSMNSCAQLGTHSLGRSRSARCEALAPASGSYRSACVYFVAIAAHQLRRLGSPVEDVIRHCIKDTRRSISRGCGVAALKASYPVGCLVVFVVYAPLYPFDLDSVDSAGDMMIIMSWWMLREVESSAAMYSHLYLNLELMEATLWMPVSKTDIRSTMAARAVACACKILQNHFMLANDACRGSSFFFWMRPAARKPRSPRTGRTACHTPEKLHEQLA